jgi:hypothetical protein
MDVHDLRHLANNKPDVLLFNPLLKDFSYKLKDFDEVILKGNQITSVDGRIADRIRDKLATFIMNEKEMMSSQENKDKVNKEIEVKL